MKKLLFLSLLCLLFQTNLIAQSIDSLSIETETSPPCCSNSDVIGISYITGYMIPHAKEVLNVRGTNPRGIELNYYSHLNNDEVWLDCECYPRLGAFISFYDFEITDILGYGFSCGINFTYFFGLPSDYNFHLKGKAGFAYLTKPFDKNSNPKNMSYSTHFNYILSAGAGITIKLLDQLELQVEGSMNHQSNAALLEPNGGINYWALSSSLNYLLEPIEFKPRQVKFDPYLNEPKKARWDLSLSWGISSMPYPEPGQVPMYGITINRSIQVYRIMALLFGAEFERNGRAVELFRRYRPDESVNPYRFSLLGGVEFLMGKTLFSVQFGGYLFIPFRHFVADGYPPRTFEDRTYQRWGLVYNIMENFYAGINFKSYRNSADHLSLRFTYSF
ncbi:acyloxyacyl hydrolase [Ignavibacterium sp.]|uniref:acyloxyacyl hydrolase n=1 Tax=Ignavibacterium sp. TaxID=2651167 RepID=UPI00307F4A82